MTRLAHQDFQSRVQHSRGFTLTELAIVLGVIGTILGSIWAASATVSHNNMINREQKDLMTIAQNIRSAYANRGSFSQTTWTDMTTSLISANIFPSDLTIDANGYPLDREGGEIKVEFPANSPNATTSTFEIEFSGTPKTCTQLAGTMVNASPVGGPTYVYYPQTNTWFQTGGGYDAGNFVGCTYVSFAFQLN